MGKLKSSKHIEFLTIAARNMRRFWPRTAAILLPLFIVMALASTMTFLKDGMLRNELYALNNAPDAGMYLEDPQHARRMSELIGVSHEDTQVLTKDMLSGAIRQWYEGRSGVLQLMWLILLLTVLLLAWTQASSISLEMKKEIGILKTLGWQTLDIIELKMIEIVMIGLSGIVCGMLSGILYLFVSGPLPIYIERGSLVMLFAIGLFPLCAATIFPVWLIGTIEPDAAIRSV